MRIHNSFVLLFLLLLSTQVLAQDYASNRLIIRLVDGVNNPREVFNSYDDFPMYEFRNLRSKKNVPIYILHFKNDEKIMDWVVRLSNHPFILYAEPDYIGYAGGQQMLIPNDTYFESRQWGLINNGNFPLVPSKEDADIDMEEAWEIETGDPEMILAILDSGLKMDHPEVKNRMWINEDEEFGGQDLDNNGYVGDGGSGWDFANEDPVGQDDHGHGTNVTGIMAAEADNGIGYAGVNWNAKIMNLKILQSNGSGFYSWWTEAIFYAVDNGAKVLNMSVGGTGLSVAMEDAIKYAHENDVAVVACMMNTDDNKTHYPAGYDEVISVGSVDPDDERSSPFFWSFDSGSCYGEHIDLVAPGNYTYGLSNLSDSNFASYWGGTSQASPHVAGVVSLIFSINPLLTVEEVRQILHESSEDLTGKDTEDMEGFDIFYGHGRLNAYNALQLAQGTVSVEDMRAIDFQVFPSPVEANSELFVKANEPIQSIQIWSIDGKMLNEWNVNNSLFNIPSVDLPSEGKYYIIVKIGDRQGHRLVEVLK